VVCLFSIFFRKPETGITLGCCAGEYRILQAVEPVRGGAGSDSGWRWSWSWSGAASRPDVRRAAVVEPRSPPLDAPNRDPADRAQHRTLSPGGEEALRAENGAKMQPTPQRDRGDGLAYTKRVGSALCLFCSLPSLRSKGSTRNSAYARFQLPLSSRMRSGSRARNGSTVMDQLGIVCFVTRACDTNNGR
jgi:hypothetical protein